jgi:hypothetical protein
MKLVPYKRRLSIEERDAEMQKILDTCLELGHRKSRAYGGDDPMGNMRKAGWIGTVIRLGDKSDRLNSLITLDTNESSKLAESMDESIEDTLLDIINYAMFTLIMKKENEGCGNVSKKK